MILFTPCRSALSVTVLAAGLAVLLPVTASAQMGMGGPSTMNAAGAANQLKGPNGSNPAKPEVQPDALPGAKSTAPIAPASKSTADMAPTDALFDAINRGDLTAARDALNRGADLNGHNLLGMTPLELSVDLSRNDITFVILSMRTEEQPSAPADNAAPAATAQAGKQSGSKRTAAAARSARTAQRGPAQTGPAQLVPTSQVPSAPRLFANDGGTPNPAAGFLGFDPSSATH